MYKIDAILIDIETFSSEDLTKSGVYRYAEAPDFRILLFGYTLRGDSEAYVVDLDNGQQLPDDVLLALLDPECVKWAYNASFERVCLSRYLRDRGYLRPGEYLDPHAWLDAMAQSAALGWPLSLAEAGKALGLDRQKMEEGRDLIRFFCRPAAPSLLTDGDCPRNRRYSDPKRWALFKDYNARDVLAESELLTRLCRISTFPDSFWAEYALDQRVNDRGIRVDRRLVDSAIVLDRLSHAELASRLSCLTGTSNPNSTAQIRKWLEEHGSAVESLSRKQVRALLDTVNPKIREVLNLRLQLAKSSVRKYEAIQHSVCTDGRVRGMFQFYGAPRSGRWAGRGVQLQNLPQNHLPDLDQARSLVADRDYETLKMLYDSVPDVLSELIRTAFIPAAGKKFIVADFSAIEARVIAWLAGETWRSQVFSGGGDIYCASASKMFGVPVEKHGVNAHLRQKGKVAELALGYGGGVGALRAMGALDMGVPEEELQPLVNAWRQASPHIVRLWWDVDHAVKQVVRDHTRVYIGMLCFDSRSDTLFIRLPSGRRLAYVNPRIGQNRFGGESVTYLGLGATRKWERIESYGPKFVENIVQGIARDLLVSAMLRLESEGYPIVAHIHDEVIIEVRPDGSVPAVCGLMAQTPDWAKGLILNADGYECGQYEKR